MRAMRWVMTAGIAATLAGCGVAFESGAHFANDREPPGRATFAWDDESDRTQGDVRLQDNAFFHARLHEAVEWELNLRGIRQSESDPTYLIHHHFSLADHSMEREVIDEAGYRSTESFVYEGGSVVLHVVDARTHADVWVAWAQGNVEPALVSPDIMRDWVYDLVGAMFKGWPVPTRAASE